MICVHTGSAGLESIMVDKPVYIISENYYSFGKLPHYSAYYDGFVYPTWSEKDKKSVLNTILSSTLLKE